MFWLNKKIIKDQKQYKFRRSKKTEMKEEKEEEIKKYYIGLLKNNLIYLDDDMLRMIISQAVYMNCYELFLQKNRHFEENFELAWSETDSINTNVKLVIEKFNKCERKLKNRFSAYIIEACTEIINERIKNDKPQNRNKH